MKSRLFIPLAVAASFLISGCGVNNALVVNQNLNTTQVELSENNYRILETVTGSAEVDYVLIFGGMKRTRLYENAYFDMVKKANLTGSKALINIVTEEHIGGVPPFYTKRTITVSAHVIEFTD